MNVGKTVAFTGHRPKSLPWGYDETDPRCVAFKRVLRAEIERAIQSGYVFFVIGMAQGIDMIAGQLVLDLKSYFPEIKLEAAIPFLEQANSWPTQQQEQYRNLLSRCDAQRIVCDKPGVKSYDKRNKYMVDKAKCIISIWNGSPSGTGNTVTYARKMQREVIIINPDNFNVDYSITDQ